VLAGSRVDTGRLGAVAEHLLRERHGVRMGCRRSGRAYSS
jgi:hypothetical protein